MGAKNESLTLQATFLKQLLGIESSLPVSLIKKIKNFGSDANLKKFYSCVQSELFLFMREVDGLRFGLVQTNNSTSADEFYNHIYSIISTIPAVGSLARGLGTAHVADSIRKREKNNYKNLLPQEIKAGDVGNDVHADNPELLRRLQAMQISAELTLQYYSQIKQLRSDQVQLAADYAVFSIGHYLTYYIRCQEKGKQCPELTVSNITDAVAVRPLDNSFAETLIHIKTSSCSYSWRVGELFAKSGICYNGVYESADPNTYSQATDQPHDLARVYGYRKLSSAHAKHFKEQSPFIQWHHDNEPLDQANDKAQKLKSFSVSKPLSQKIWKIVTPSKNKILKGLIFLMSLILILGSLFLIALGIAAVWETSFLGDLFSAVTDSLGLNQFSGSMLLTLGIGVIALLGITYLCLWLEDDAPPVNSYFSFAGVRQAQSNNTFTLAPNCKHYSEPVKLNIIACDANSFEPLPSQQESVEYLMQNTNATTISLSN